MTDDTDDSEGGPKRVAQCMECDHEMIVAAEGSTPSTCAICGSSDVYELRRTTDRLPDDESE